jgi:hypothetical protein
LQFDHLHPIARGGRFAVWNTTIACSRCNQLRGLLTEAETLELREFLEGLHPVARQDIERRLHAGGQRYASRRPPTRPRPATAGEAAELVRAEMDVLRAKLERHSSD